ncbi:hypothetical protein [Streptomyces sp. SAI-127]|uniref:hypothetical protein n=1 Tax=Streptomyces sp. SAI-127 TaxID=2940543 RepID=UPI0024751F9A|nr:hypothetical protein [Streptomyces sp. SAI-127]MDH6491484.1 methyl-accepting chemotaxis protein [Streptomyces sp. SAI-127]
MAEDIRVLVERLTTRVGILEGTENFTARFKEQFAQQFAKDSSVPEGFKKAVQGEIAAWKEQQDAAQKKLLDPKWHADNVPVTGAKVEATGLKADVFVGQFEYGLFKHEYSLTKFLEDRAQHKREQEVDRQLAGLTSADRQLREQLSSLKTKLGRVSQVANDGDQRSKSGRTKTQELNTHVTALRNAVNGILRTQHTDDQRVRGQITALKTRISRISQVANDADQRSKSLRLKANNLDRQVRAGLQRVRELEGSARGAGRSIQGLRNDLNSLEQTLRR